MAEKHCPEGAKEGSPGQAKRSPGLAPSPKNIAPKGRKTTGTATAPRPSPCPQSCAPYSSHVGYPRPTDRAWQGMALSRPAVVDNQPAAACCKAVQMVWAAAMAELWPLQGTENFGADRDPPAALSLAGGYLLAPLWGDRCSAVMVIVRRAGGAGRVRWAMVGAALVLGGAVAFWIPALRGNDGLGAAFGAGVGGRCGKPHPTAPLRGNDGLGQVGRGFRCRRACSGGAGRRAAYGSVTPAAPAAGVAER